MAIFNFKNRFTSGFDQNALTTTTDSEHVFNFGRLTTTGDLADAIFAGADNVTIRNFAGSRPAVLAPPASLRSATMPASRITGR